VTLTGMYRCDTSTENLEVIELVIDQICSIVDQGSRDLVKSLGKLDCSACVRLVFKQHSSCL